MIADCFALSSSAKEYLRAGRMPSDEELGASFFGSYVGRPEGADVKKILHALISEDLLFRMQPPLDWLRPPHGSWNAECAHRKPAANEASVSRKPCPDCLKLVADELLVFMIVNPLYAHEIEAVRRASQPVGYAQDGGYMGSPDLSLSFEPSSGEKFSFDDAPYGGAELQDKIAALEEQIASLKAREKARGQERGRRKSLLRDCLLGALHVAEYYLNTKIPDHLKFGGEASKTGMELISGFGGNWVNPPSPSLNGDVPPPGSPGETFGG